MIKKGYELTLISHLEKNIFIHKMDRKLINTGIFIIYPKKIKYHIFLKKQFIEAICCIHIVVINRKNQSRYYREIKMIITNIFFERMKIQPEKKLAIINIIEENQINWKKSDLLNTSIRGINSFGSTGI